MINDKVMKLTTIKRKYMKIRRHIKDFAVEKENHDAYNALEGGHVKKVGCDDDSWYITPLCHICNSATNDDEMTVHKDDLAPYNEIKDL